MEKRIASLAAQLVLAEAHSERTAPRNASATPVSPLYRFEELRPLEQWQRHALVQRAAGLADREPFVIALCAASLALLMSLAFASPAWFHGWAMTATLVFCPMPFLFYQRLRIRHHVQQLLGTLDVETGAAFV